MKSLPSVVVLIIIMLLLFSKKKRRRYRKKLFSHRRRYYSHKKTAKSGTAIQKVKSESVRQRAKREITGRNKSLYLNSEYYKKTLIPWSTIESDKGRRGEYEVFTKLANLAAPRDFFFNVYIPREDGTTTEADIVMVHPKGIFVYEVKNYEGWIFGKYEQYQWTQCLPGQNESTKNQFFNPLKQNDVHVRVLSKYLDIPEARFVPITVFSNDCEFKDLSGNAGGKTPNLCKFSTVFAATELASMKSEYEMTANEYTQLCSKIGSLCNADEATKAAHIMHVKEQQEKARARFAKSAAAKVSTAGVSPNASEKSEASGTTDSDEAYEARESAEIPEKNEATAEIPSRKLCPSCGSEIKAWENNVCHLCGTRID